MHLTATGVAMPSELPRYMMHLKNNLNLSMVDVRREVAGRWDPGGQCLLAQLGNSIRPINSRACRRTNPDHPEQDVPNR